MTRLSPLSKLAAMKIIVNGKEQQLTDGANAQQLVEELGLAGLRIAMELNGEIVPRSHYHERPLAAGDRVEIVHAIGGGQH